MQAGWAESDTDESNWLDEAAHAHPDPDAAVYTLYDLAASLVERLAEGTGEDRGRVLTQALH